MKDAVPNGMELGQLFSTIRGIHDVSAKILVKFRSRIIDTYPVIGTVGDIFLEFLPRFQGYVAYINNFDRANEIYTNLRENDTFVQFDENARMKSEQQPLPSILITPVQRIPRYILLLQELIKLTPTYHRDYHLLKEAIDKLVETTENINKKKADQAALLQIQSEITAQSDQWSIVTPDRKLIREGPVQYRNDKNKTVPAHLYLMNDLLLITTISSSSVENVIHTVLQKGKKQVRNLIASTSLKFVSLDATSSLLGEFKVEFELEGRGKSWCFLCSSSDDAKSWLDTIRDAIGSCLLQGQEASDSEGEESVASMREELLKVKDENRRLLSLQHQETQRRKELENRIAMLEKHVLSISEKLADSEDRADNLEASLKEKESAHVRENSETVKKGISSAELKKDTKEAAREAAKESKTKESKEAKDHRGIAREPSISKDKELNSKDPVRDLKDSKDSKEAKEGKDTQDSKDAKEPKDSKDSKDSIKDAKSKMKKILSKNVF
jgi:hypothetical protein